MGRRIIIGRSKLNPETRRWVVILIVLAGALGVYGMKRAGQLPDEPIIGNPYVIDGDTISVAGRRIRLVDIDAPELDQSCQDGRGKAWPCGRASAQALKGLLRGRDVSCRPRAFDQYHRVLGVCSLPDSTDVNAWMVQEGLAVTSGFAKVYGAQESAARAARHGLWAGDFMPPRDWRRRHPRSDHADPKD